MRQQKRSCMRVVLRASPTAPPRQGRPIGQKPPHTIREDGSSEFASVALIYRRTGNLRAVQLLLGHTKLESTGQIDI
jgi:site-specific recombinase XerC